MKRTEKGGEVGMADRITVMSWLEGLAQDDWRMLHSDSEVQEIARSAIALLKEQESLKHKMWNALYAEEDKLEKHYVSTDEFDKWIVDYRPFLQRGFEIAIEVIAANEEGR